MTAAPHASRGRPAGRVRDNRDRHAVQMVWKALRVVRIVSGVVSIFVLGVPPGVGRVARAVWRGSWYGE